MIDSSVTIAAIAKQEHAGEGAMKSFESSTRVSDPIGGGWACPAYSRGGGACHEDEMLCESTHGPSHCSLANSSSSSSRMLNDRIGGGWEGVSRHENELTKTT